MGAEAICALSENGARHTGHALLETDELIFRGNDGYRVKLPLATLKRIEAVNGKLLLDGPKGTISIELGDEKAKRWADAIRSPKGLLDKLDLKPTHVVALIGVDDEAFANELASRVASVTRGRTPKGANMIFLWADRAAALKRIATIVKSMARDGAIWVVHPKGAGAKVKDTDIFAVGKKAGLTATKVARFSETHTAEKLVIPVAKR
jgi:DUF3052 family protein